MFSAALATLAALLVTVSGQEAREFSYYTLAVQHGAGFCLNNTACTKITQVSQSPEWTIHGLWPSNIAFCGGHKFDPNELNAMLPRLRQVWPSYTRSSDAAFWRYQFTKHGGCAIGSPKIGTVSAYFGTTLRIYQDFVERVLNYFQIHAGTVDARSLEDSIRHRLGKSVRLSCRKGVAAVDVLAEVRVCYSRSNLEIIDCPGESNCAARAYFAGRARSLSNGISGGHGRRLQDYPYQYDSVKISVPYERVEGSSQARGVHHRVPFSDSPIPWDRTRCHLYEAHDVNFN